MNNTEAQSKSVFLLNRELAGTWKGTGKGRYPTIADFEYKEIFRIEQISPRPLFHFLQETRFIDSGEPLHYESGFIVVQEDGNVLLNTAQDGGRVEVLTGTIKTDTTALTIECESLLFGNDERLVKTRRVYTINNGALSFRMYMQTGRTDLTQHLESKLTKAVNTPVLLI